jgi:hypothetical protein
MRVLVRAGAGLAIAGAAHSVVNARFLRVPVRPDRPLGAMPLLVPARDEAANISSCVRALHAQGRVTVLDDQSSDGTGELAARAGATVIRGTPPPDGWLGKPWACEQLAAAAGADADVLVFVDADVCVAPGGVAAAVALLRDADLDIVCPFPRQIARTLSERLVQPLLQWSWLTFLPLRAAEELPRRSLTAACGQFVVVRRSALDRAGGFTAVRDAVLDDVALVRAVKASGGRGGVADGSQIATCRMYTGWRELRDGYSKSLWSAVGSPAGAVGVVGVLALGWVLPAGAALCGSRVGALGYAAGVASRLVAARRSGSRAMPDALAHPLSVALLCTLTARSMWLGRRGRLVWKGRQVPSVRIPRVGVRRS